MQLTLPIIETDETEPRLYRYSQLSDKAKARARDWWRKDYDCPGLSELLETELRDHFGVTGCKLHYSLGYCQGDGVAFEGTPDLEEWAKHDQSIQMHLAKITLWCVANRADVPEIYVEIKHEGHYYHWNSMTVRVESWYGDVPYFELGSETSHDIDAETESLVKELEDYLNEAVKKVSRELETIGYAEIEHQKSDEHIDEVLMDNDAYYRWDEGGYFEG